MTRKRRGITDLDVTRWIGQGLGQGEGAEYRPWIKIRDVPSRGRSTRVAALRVHRTHHLLSDIEYAHFLMADFRIDTVEIRDQMALLPREDTLSLAEEFSIPHPRYPGTRTATVLTSDLWVNTYRNGASAPYALCVKPSEVLSPGAKGIRRTIEKLTIERRFWTELGVPWRLVTEYDCDPQVVLNLGLLRPHPRIWRSVEWQDNARKLADVFHDREAARRPLRVLLESTGFELQIAFQQFGLAVWKHWISMDLRQPLRWTAPVALICREALDA